MGAKVERTVVVHTMNGDAVVEVVLFMELLVPKPVFAAVDGRRVLFTQLSGQAIRVVLDSRAVAREEIMAHEDYLHPFSRERGHPGASRSMTPKF
jgi:hypothetical protein